MQSEAWLTPDIWKSVDENQGIITATALTRRCMSGEFILLTILGMAKIAVIIYYTSSTPGDHM
jgi:hypothetical protein